MFFLCLVFLVGVATTRGFIAQPSSSSGSTCSSSNCNYHGNCTVQNGSVSCQCDRTHEGHYCEHVKASSSSSGYTQYTCDHSHCNFHGQCTWYNQQRICHCDDTHEGQYCQHLKAPQAGTSVPHAKTCFGSSCNNHGTCIVHNGDLHCQCDSTHEGTYCEHLKAASTYTSCDETYCNNQGHCVKINGLTTCQCDHYFAGERCDLTDFCVGGFCQHGSTCESTHIAPNYFRCICPTGYTGTFCESRSSVTTNIPTSVAVTTTTTPTVAVTTHAFAFRFCDKLALVPLLAYNDSADVVGAPTCPDGSHTSSEALLLATCNVSQPADWRQGIRVLDYCASIPVYTSIATFVSRTYPLTLGLSGVFLGCLDTAFKMAVQECGHAPRIVHVEGGSAMMNPDIYYTVL